MKYKIICHKCGKKGDKYGHLVSEIDPKSHKEQAYYYHWDCYDKEYNKKIELLFKIAEADDKKRKI